MKGKLQLTKFFIYSFYKKPKQTMLKVVLLIAIFYMICQLTIINAFIFFLGDTSIFIVYNLMLSCLLVYVFTGYLSTSQAFAYNEFKLLTPLPLSSKDISMAKVTSSIWIPIFLSIIIQIPTLGFLIVDFKFVEAIKLCLFIPVVNGLIALFLMFVLSFINRYYYKFKSKLVYLLINIFIMLLIPFLLFMYFIRKSSLELSKLISQIDINSIKGIKKSLEFILAYIYDITTTVSVMKSLVKILVSSQINIYFILSCISILVISFLFYYFIIENISVNYFKNGVSENSKISFKSSKVRITKNQWSNYLQREIWIIKSEAYFKMQVVLGFLLPIIFTTILLILIQNEVLPDNLNITKDGFLNKYFSYSVLFFCCINNISGTPYSREGKYYNLLKINPFDSKYVYFSKVIFASTVSVAAVLLSFLLFALFGHSKLEDFVMMLIISCLVVCYNLLTPLFDMKNPSTEWDNPSEAIKSNPNVLISLLYGMPMLIVIAALHFCLIWIGIQPFLVDFMILAIATTTIFILVNKLKTTL
ncbi:hypothetical protein [Priestia megaterium]|jgi:hypothetical protein|uniref:hypothetical protein n=1 Tax=Priestia megaterium TaxID=1404 RepID=UPI0008EEFFC0|nr:hypothetical protein [Priestia megaterium]MED4265943.1 hypothetical protein [Priestia megaterium]MED4275267.1 hypothetical protein [Priestia megaterium]MED4280972.1 hypothetical protein [Priestia megaterium]MED4315421.1 hypothetical protein [Priestia megaterium]SFG73228.1 hypothetical protein SAMN04487776_103146 [Priestia megaterium]